MARDACARARERIAASIAAFMTREGLAPDARARGRGGDGGASDGCVATDDGCRSVDDASALGNDRGRVKTLASFSGRPSDANAARARAKTGGAREISATRAGDAATAATRDDDGRDATGDGGTAAGPVEAGERCARVRARDADDFDALVKGFVEEEEAEADGDARGADEDARMDAVDAAKVVETRARVEQTELTAADAHGTRPGTTVEAVETETRTADVEPKSSEGAEEAKADLTMMFPSSKRRPMGTLGGFDEVMRVKKKRAKRSKPMPKPRYDPTPKLLEDDLVALPASQIVGLNNVVDEEDDYDNIDSIEMEDAFDDAREEVLDTDVDDSPQVTEVPRHVTLPTDEQKFPSSTVRVVGRAEGTINACAMTDMNGVVTEDAAITDVEEGEEVTQPDETPTDVEEAPSAFPGVPVKSAIETVKANVYIGRSLAMNEPEQEALPAANPTSTFPGKPVSARMPTSQVAQSDITLPSSTQEPVTENVESAWDPSAGFENVPGPVKRGRGRPPKIVAETLLAKTVMQLIESTLAVSDLTKPQYSHIIRESMHKITTTVPKEFDQNTEEGTRAFLSDSCKQKIHSLLDTYVTRLKRRSNSKHSTTQKLPPHKQHVYNTSR
ncbi:unnamed product [Ostreococcus tauri]|uniref:Unnamed product n=1 Tax=Ostreococcus tauri TaxID=70448 RepID=A0A096P791_OSTTA|nr:unnamed product [Ostreococcus tauri]CEF96986.1 unnamed product [Ostreococcus tauri]|eukprot:XP_003077969.2 unnamed product [Ostreococcus tauri]